MWFRRKKEKRGWLEKISSFINDPIVAILFSLATTLAMAGFTSGKFLYEYNSKLSEAIEELKTLQAELKEIKRETEDEYYPRSELDLKVKILEERIKQLDSRIAKLEASIFN